MLWVPPRLSKIKLSPEPTQTGFYLHDDEAWFNFELQYRGYLYIPKNDFPWRTLPNGYINQLISQQRAHVFLKRVPYNHLIAVTKFSVHSEHTP